MMELRPRLIESMMGVEAETRRSQARFQITVELQWLEHLWDHENLFETGEVRANEGWLYRQVRRHNKDLFDFL